MVADLVLEVHLALLFLFAEDDDVARALEGIEADQLRCQGRGVVVAAEQARGVLAVQRHPPLAVDQDPGAIVAEQSEGHPVEPGDGLHQAGEATVQLGCQQATRKVLEVKMGKPPE